MFYKKAKLLPFYFLSVLLLLVFCDLGDRPIGTNVTSTTSEETLYENVALDSITDNMRIFITPSSIHASNTDEAQVTVIVYDDNHNPVAGKEVSFIATHGAVTAKDTTDESGKATATFYSVPINAQARVIAQLKTKDSTLAVAASVWLTGISVLISPDYTNALVDKEVPVTVTVLDGSGEPVSNAELEIDGAVDTSGLTNGDGVFKTSVTSSSQGEVNLKVATLGAMDSTTLTFWNELPTGSSEVVRSDRRLRVYSSRSQLKANTSDYAEITAILSNEKNNPLSGDTVLFSSNLGIIEEYSVVDSSGRAKVRLTSSPINGVCNVVASVAGADSRLRDSVSVIFSGISLELTSEQTSFSIGDTASVNVFLKDGSGNAVGGDDVTFRITSSAGTFTDGSKIITGKLDPNGNTEVKVTSTSAGTLAVEASALNSTGTINIYFATNYLTISTSKEVVTVGGNDSCKITALYKDKDGHPVNNVLIMFASNAGDITDDSVTTNSDGKAETYLKSSMFSGTATVQAVASNKTSGNAFVNVKFTTNIASSVKLEVTPDNISVNGGVATLVATVVDSNGNMVSGTDVNFKILRGPGGGEYIKKPVMATYNGKARSEIVAGTVPSQYRACKVIAIVNGGIVDTTKLTISGEPYVITVSRPEEDTITVSNAGNKHKSTFDFNIGAVVQDINGNPVADGTKVQFSAVVSGMSVAKLRFLKWKKSTEEGTQAILVYSYYDVPFEDINNNFKMDENIDLKLDYLDNVARRGDDVNGDGVMDYNPYVHDFFYDFNGNGICDTGVGEPAYESTALLDTISSSFTINSISVLDSSISTIDSAFITDSVATVDSVFLKDSVVIELDSTQNPTDTTWAYTERWLYEKKWTYSTKWVYDTIWAYGTKLVYDTVQVYTTKVTGYETWADLNQNGMWDSTELVVDHNNNGVCDLPASGDYPYWRWEMRPYWTGERFDFVHNEFAVVIEASVTTEGGVAQTVLTYPRQMARRLYVTVNAEANGIRDRDGERFVLPVITGN